MDNFNLIEFLAKNPLREAEASDLEKSYKKDVPQFVDDLKQYAKDPKVSAILKAGQADGDPNDDKLPYTQTSVKVGGLIPTQNEIDFNKSVLHILDDQFGSLSSILNGKANVGNPIVTYNGKWIIDGHHRWSQVLAANPNAKMDALDIKGNLPPEDVLKAVHGAIAATTGKVPSSSVGEGSMNVLSASDDAVRANLEKLINDPSNFPSKAEALWREKGFDSKEKIVNYIANNLKSIRQQGHIQKAPGRISMPQTDADGAIKDKLDALAKGDVNISPPFVTENIKKNMNNFNLKNFINENNLGAYSRMKEDTVSEQSAFVLAADAAKDAGKDEFEFPEGSGKMHKVKLKQDIPVEEGMGGEMAEILGAFLALVGAGKTALEAVKILGDEHGDISISSIKDAIKQYKASKKIGEELSDEEADKFHTKLDNLVHKTFGPSSDEKDMNEELDEKYDREDGDGHLGTNTDDDFEREQLAQLAARNEEIGMEYEYDDIVGPLMQSLVKMEKWVAQHASDDTEAVQLLQLAKNAVENFDNYMAYGTEMNEELSMKDITSGQRSYQQMKPYFIAKVIGLKPETEQKASELVLKKSKAFPGMTQIIKTAKTPEEVENVVFFDGYPDEDQTIRFSGLEYELYQVTPNPKIDRLKEEASGLEFKVGDKVTYLGHPGTITNAGTDIMDRPIYSVSYNKGTGDTKVTNVYNKSGVIKPMKESSLNLSDAL